MMIYAYVIGFLSQALFSARILFQWILSEKAQKVLSPVIFWILSLAGSYLMFIYGWMRDDFSILLGQMISYYIYIWNLYEQGVWKRINILGQGLLFLTPLVAVAFVCNHAGEFMATFLKNDKIPLRLLLLGSLGQVIFTFRFVYQFIYSARRKESLLPVGFWVMSLLGSLLIVIYGVIRRDPVLVLGQSVGFVAYFRNIVLERRSPHQPISEE
ncbi:MAG: putative lipid-A-disaccharide synthase [Bacteroidetes bacterium]|nr:putative lipid-A-disaccharide synthase [Bacteroidota bacterium]